MSEKFKGHQVTKSRATSAAPQLSKAELQAQIEAKRRAAKAKEVPTDEVGGPEGPEPTRYGDWEVGGRVSDF